MTAKFEAFRLALEELCVEHGVRMYEGHEYEDYNIYVELVSCAVEAGCDIDLVNVMPPTPEEIAAQEALNAERQAENARRFEQARQRWEETMASPTYQAMKAEAIRDANRKREDYMRITKDPTQTGQFDDRPRRAWVNDREIHGWIVADEFRRVVITADQVYNGAVRIERLPEVGQPAAEPAAEVRSDITGMFVAVPDPKPEAPKVEAPKPQPNPVPKFSPKAGKHRK